MVDCIHGGHEPNKSFESCFLLGISNHNFKNGTNAASINTFNVYSYRHIYISCTCVSINDNDNKDKILDL